MRLALFVVYVAAAVALVAIVPARTLHAESAAVVAVAGCLTTGLWTISLLRRSMASVRGLAVLVVPPASAFALLITSTALHPGCWSGDGVILFLAFVPAACLFGGSAAYLAWSLCPKRAALLMCVFVGLSALASLVFDLGLHPQMYSYSHVFGGVLGPVYDAELAVRPGVFTYRLLTVLWSGLFVVVGRMGRERFSAPRATVVGAILLLIASCYVWRVPLGFNSSSQLIRESLGGNLQTENFDIWYPATAGSLSDSTLSAIAGRQEAELERISATLGATPGERISVYIYLDPSRRANLTGVRSTSVAPVWLNEPQIHLLASRHDSSFSHELVHVLAREFGAWPFNASWKLALVEGIAVALEASQPSPDLDDVVRLAAREFEMDPGSLARRMRSLLSPGGFWTARGAIAYSASGSFVSYLINQYDIDAFRRVYAGETFREAYSVDIESLISDWIEQVLSAPITADAARQDALLAAITRPSMFESACPHVP